MVENVVELETYFTFANRLVNNLEILLKYHDKTRTTSATLNNKSRNLT